MRQEQHRLGAKDELSSSSNCNNEGKLYQLMQNMQRVAICEFVTYHNISAMLVHSEAMNV